MGGEVLRRVGTLFAGFLTAKGVDAETANQIVIGLGALAAVGLDLGLAAYARKKRNET